LSLLIELWNRTQGGSADYYSILSFFIKAENEITRLGKFCGEYQLLWKIRDYRRVYEEATNETRITIQSPIFDTHRNGYKMQLSMCPNGDGKGRSITIAARKPVGL
jgi:hypothetical protein